MSGTRSPSLPEPATRVGKGAVLIAAHGDCGGDCSNMLAGELARRIKRSGHYDEVAVGFLRCAPLIEEAVAHISSAHIRIYPLFMSDGYYVREAIPKRLGIQEGVDPLGHRIDVDPPLGLHPLLPELLLSAAAGTALAAGLRPQTAVLLLVAHGSANSPHSANVAREVGKAMEHKSVFASVVVAFLEEEPYFNDVLRTIPRPAFVLGLFAGGGLHADEDIHRIVKELDDPSIHIVEQLGGYAGVVELVAASVLIAD
jgi:sirohydrochlorin cobaltochelatase